MTVFEIGAKTNHKPLISDLKSVENWFSVVRGIQAFEELKLKALG